MMPFDQRRHPPGPSQGRRRSGDADPCGQSGSRIHVLSTGGAFRLFSPLPGRVNRPRREGRALLLHARVSKRLLRRGSRAPSSGAVFDALLDAGDTHATEIAYWSESDDPDPENWWPIAESIIEHKAARAQRPTAVSSAGLSMRGLELRDADSRGFLSFDLRDILACLGRDAIERMWTWQDVDCTGEGVDEFFEAVYQGQAIPGSRLIRTIAPSPAGHRRNLLRKAPRRRRTEHRHQVRRQYVVGGLRQR